MIIGIKENGKVVLAYSSFDSLSNMSANDMANKDNVGLWRVKINPHTIMGCEFPTSESDAFRFEDDIFQGEINYDKLMGDIIPAMEKFAEDKDYIGSENGRFEEFFIAQNDRLFTISFEHMATEINSYVAGGVGDLIARSVLYATEGMPAIDRIRKAMEFAAQSKQFDCYPITIMDTATCRLKTLTREDK